MTHLFGYSIPLPPYLTVGLFAAFWVFLSWFLSHIFQTHVCGWAEKANSVFGKLLVRVLHGPLLAFLLLIGGEVILEAVEVPLKMLRFAQVSATLVAAFVLIYAGVRLYHGILIEYGKRYEPIRPSLNILNLVGQALIIIIGLLITLDSLTISITPLLTTLGIGGLAVALAFKDTLANFFAGLYILADRPVRGGDYIKVENGPEGYVESIGWRSTRMRNLIGKLVVIPNSKLSESIITNYHLPDRRMPFSLSVNVSYESDPRKVEAILVEEAVRAASEVDGLLSEPVPSVTFIPGFGESSLTFSLNLHIREFIDQYRVQHELRHRIFRRFKEEGLEIPFPQRTVHLREKKN